MNVGELEVHIKLIRLRGLHALVIKSLINGFHVVVSIALEVDAFGLVQFLDRHHRVLLLANTQRFVQPLGLLMLQLFFPLPLLLLHPSIIFEPEVVHLHVGYIQILTRIWARLLLILDIYLTLSSRMHLASQFSLSTLNLLILK